MGDANGHQPQTNPQAALDALIEPIFANAINGLTLSMQGVRRPRSRSRSRACSASCSGATSAGTSRRCSTCARR